MFSARRQKLSWPVLLLIFSVIWVSGKIAFNDLRDATGNDPTSVNVAVNLLDHGVVSDRRYDEGRSSPPPALRGGPTGYGVVLAGMGLVAPSLTPLLRCFSKSRHRCTLPFDAQRPAIIIHSLFAVLSLILVFCAAWGFSRSEHVAGLTVLLTAAFGDFEHYAVLLRPGILLYLSFAASLCCAALFCRTDRPLWAFLASASMGFTALVQPTYAFAAILSALFMVCAAGNASYRQVDKSSTRWFPIKIQTALSCGLGLAVTTGAWSVYMYTLFGDPWPTDSHFGKQLAMRAAFGMIDTSTVWTSLIYWLPSHGDSVAQLLLPTPLYAPLAPWGEGSMELVGQKVIWPDAIAAAGSKRGVFDHLVATSVLPEPGWHFLTSAPVFLRGLFGAGHLLGLVGLLLLPSFFKVARVRGRGAEAGLLVLPIAMTLAWQSAFTPNPAHLCLPVLFVCAYVVADRLGSI